MPVSSGISVVKEPLSGDRVYAPLGATQTYLAGAPVNISGGLLVVSASADLAALLDGNFVGIAAESAAGNLSDHRTGLTFGGGAGGAQTGTMRAFIPATSDEVIYATQNFWADPTATPPTRTAITGALIGVIRPLALAVDATLAGGRQWGLDDTAGTPGTHACGYIIGVLDSNGQPVSGSTAGSTILFRIVSTSTQLVGS